MEMKEKGEFEPSGSDDVLTRALETPKHSGRVWGVGSFVSPKLWFDLPKEKRIRITKGELMVRDRQRDEEMEKTRQEMERTKLEMEKTKQEIAELKSLLSASNITSSPLSDKGIFQGEKAGPALFKAAPPPSPIKELIIDDAMEYVGEDPPPPEKKVKYSVYININI